MNKILTFLNTPEDIYLPLQAKNVLEKNNISFNLDYYILDIFPRWRFNYSFKESCDNLAIILHNYLNNKDLFYNLPDNDRYYYLKELISNIKLFDQYDIYCFSLFEIYIDTLLVLALYIKKLYPESKILFGGPEVILNDNICNILRKLDFDYSQGDFDISLYNYITNYSNFYCLKHHQSMNKLTADDVPKYSKEELEYLNYKIMISSSRGCANKCRFCCSPALSPYSFVKREVLIEWMKYYNKIGVKEIVFNDSTFNKVDFDIFLDGLISINNKIDIRFINISFESLKLYQIEKMKKAGLKYALAGVECIHPSLQKSINKKMPTVEELFSYLDEFKKYSIEIMLYYIVGLPTQTDKIFKEELELLIEIDKKYPNINIEAYNYDASPKTYIRHNYKKYNISIHDIYDKEDIENLPIFENDLNKYKFYFINNIDIFNRMKMLYENIDKIVFHWEWKKLLTKEY